VPQPKPPSKRLPTPAWLYVIELEPAAARTLRFRKQNPEFVGDRPCFYVGGSIHDPETRFQQHKAGIKAASLVKRFGVRVVTERCRRVRVLDTMSRNKKEARLAAKLRAEGFGVYQA
jgi:hypothetical protein